MSVSVFRLIRMTHSGLLALAEVRAASSERHRGQPVI